MISSLTAVQPLRPSIRLDAVIDAIGETRFEAELLGFLNRSFGADHFGIFGFDGARPTEIAAISYDGTDTAHKRTHLYLENEHWRRDPAVCAAKQASDPLIYLDMWALEDRELREIVYPDGGERLLLCGRTSVGRLGLCFLRSSRRFRLSLSEVPELQEIGVLLLSILGKHASVTSWKLRFKTSLTSLEEIARCVCSAPEKFPPREIQVCSRILYGMSPIGIALELGIGQETIVTYRKRIYNRLSIGSQRELLIWYLARWGEQADNSLPLSVDPTEH